MFHYCVAQMRGNVGKQRVSREKNFLEKFFARVFTFGRELKWFEGETIWLARGAFGGV